MCADSLRKQSKVQYVHVRVIVFGASFFNVFCIFVHDGFLYMMEVAYVPICFTSMYLCFY